MRFYNKNPFYVTSLCHSSNEHDHVDVPVGIVVVAHVDVGHIVVIVVAVLIECHAGSYVDDTHQEVEEGEGSDAG